MYSMMSRRPTERTDLAYAADDLASVVRSGLMP